MEDVSVQAWIAAISVGYLVGSVPFGLVIVRAAGLGDIRTLGSGNIGATNVLRTGRKDLAIATLILDAGKAGLIAVLFTVLFSSSVIGLAAGAAALIGHCFPVWLKFHGGKGIATYAGLLFGAVWQVGLVAAACWLLVAVLTRRSSLAALITALIVPVVAIMFGKPLVSLVILALLTGVVFWRHRVNIERLIAGTEPRIGEKKSTPAEAP